MQILEDRPVDSHPHRQPTPTATSLILGCLMGLIALNAVMITAAFANLEPRPDADIVPFIAATAAIGIIALPLVRSGVRLGYHLGIVFAAVSMIGMGPHKLFLEDGATIAPVAIVGFLAELTLIGVAVRELRTDR